MACCCIGVTEPTVAQGTVLRSEYGMVVIVGNNDSTPAFISLCKAEIINK